MIINNGNPNDVNGNFTGRGDTIFKNLHLSKKKVILSITALILVIILYFYLPIISDLLKQTPLRQLVSKEVVLKSNDSQDIKDPNAPIYFAQNDSICDQKNLDKFFGALLVPGEAGKPLENNTRKSYYGESTWWYKIQGQVDKVQSTEGSIAYSLSKGNYTLEIPAAQNTALIQIEASESAHTHQKYTKTVKSQKIDLNSIQVGDKVMFYLTVKCGGGKPPLLFPDTIQKIPEFITKETAINRVNDAFACQDHNHTSIL